jgi:hypothetical protein
LAQIWRVLKENGRLVFLEHGRSASASVARWQTLFNPMQRVLAYGCNLNRRIDQLFADNGFTLDRLDRFVMPGVPRTGAEMYRGIASPCPGSPRRGRYVALLYWNRRPMRVVD